MTGQEYFALFSEAMRTKRIIRYENETSRDDYHTYGIRETPMGYMFFCLLETFFRRGRNADSWIPGSLTSYHEFDEVQGATTSTLILTDKKFEPIQGYREKLPGLVNGSHGWITVD
ncbi:hypothetical protein [Dyadobacter luticola]|uniref:Uncharacterized protein n=1 Tax=Dyadobacter luticola TaxID=1979387 RepID=A0A5R9L353_9BACT|nr:hypothetical protein [Dyadobacter luticola]TLV02690.1 hypothetical protein FEN17_03465 [Dyadobacter luticola]